MPVMLPWRGVVVGREHGPAINTSVHEDEAARLAELARGRHVLEVGSAYGYSAAVMALAGARSVTAVDPHHAIPSGRIMAANIDALGLSALVRMVPEFSGTCLPQFAAAGQRFGLIFVDGDHTTAAARLDAQLSVPLLEPGGVLAFHDYGNPECPEVRPVLDELYPGGPDRVTFTLWEKAL